MHHVRLAIVGARDFEDASLLQAAANRVIAQARFNYTAFGGNPQDMSVTIVSGGARGADALAADYARNRGYMLVEHAADIRDGKDKFAVQSRKIAAECTSAIAFPRGHSPGTHMTIRALKAAKKPCEVL